MVEQELSCEDRAGIRKMVSLCANFDGVKNCIPLDGICYMLTLYQGRAFCEYFENAVLPLNLEIQAMLTGGTSPSMDVRNCTVCGKLFSVYGKRSYCSDACKREGNRRKSRKRMQKMREEEF